MNVFELVFALSVHVVSVAGAMMLVLALRLPRAALARWNSCRCRRLMQIAVVLVPEHKTDLVYLDAVTKTASSMEMIKLPVADIAVLARGDEVCCRMVVSSSATCQAAAS